MTREELTMLVQAFYAKGTKSSERRKLVSWFDHECLHGAGSDLLNFPEDCGIESTPEAVVAAVFSWEPRVVVMTLDRVDAARPATLFFRAPNVQGWAYTSWEGPLPCPVGGTAAIALCGVVVDGVPVTKRLYLKRPTNCTILGPATAPEGTVLQRFT